MTTPAPSLAPARSSLPDVLPNDRLFSSGKPRPKVAPGMRAIGDARNVVAVTATWAQVLGCWWIVGRLDHPLAWVAGVAWIGRCLSLLFLLDHEAAHALLLSRRRVNDLVGRWLLSAPGLVSFDGYRAAHLSHHRDELGPDEPDMGLYAGYPSGWRRFARRLARDAFGRSATKQLRQLAALPSIEVGRIFVVQAVLFVVAAVTTGTWWSWLVLWFLPWATVWQVINRLRAVAEHAGMERSPDRRLSTHVVRQGWVPRQLLVPYRSGYHLAHHVDTSVPWTHLRELDEELQRAGWITPDVVHASYRSVWRYLVTGIEARGTGSPAGRSADEACVGAS